MAKSHYLLTTIVRANKVYNWEITTDGHLYQDIDHSYGNKPMEHHHVNAKKCNPKKKRAKKFKKFLAQKHKAFLKLKKNLRKSFVLNFPS
jgi:hypothetical protein